MKETTQKELLKSFAECMTYASGNAWQMIHEHQDPRFIGIRDLLESIKNNCIQLGLAPSDDIAARLQRSGIILP